MVFFYEVMLSTSIAGPFGRKLPRVLAKTCLRLFLALITVRCKCQILELLVALQMLQVLLLYFKMLHSVM